MYDVTLPGEILRFLNTIELIISLGMNVGGAPCVQPLYLRL